MIGREFLRFAIVGTVGFVVDAGVLYLMLYLGLGPYLGRVVSFLTAATATWLLNRRFTFRHLVGKRASLQEWLHYLLLMGLGFCINYGVYVLTLHALESAGKLAPMLSVAAGSLAGMCINFATSRTLFRRAL
jgi:putative flippase GtrA